MRNQTHYNSATQYAEMVKSTRYMEIATMLHVVGLTNYQKKVIDSIVSHGSTDNKVIVSKM